MRWNDCCDVFLTWILLWCTASGTGCRSISATWIFASIGDSCTSVVPHGRVREGTPRCAMLTGKNGGRSTDRERTWGARVSADVRDDVDDGRSTVLVVLVRHLLDRLMRCDLLLNLLAPAVQRGLTLGDRDRSG